MTITAVAFGTVAIALSCIALGNLPTQEDGTNEAADLPVSAPLPLLTTDSVYDNAAPEGGDLSTAPTSLSGATAVTYTVRFLDNEQSVGVYDSRGDLILTAPVPGATLSPNDRERLAAGVVLGTWTDALRLCRDFAG